MTDKISQTTPDYINMSEKQLRTFCREVGLPCNTHVNKTQMKQSIEKWIFWGKRKFPSTRGYNTFVKRLTEEYGMIVHTTVDDFYQQTFDIQDHPEKYTASKTPKPSIHYECIDGHKTIISFDALTNKFSLLGKTDKQIDMCMRCNLDITSTWRQNVNEICEKFNFKLLQFIMKTRTVNFICSCGKFAQMRVHAFIKHEHARFCMHSINKLYTFPSGNQIFIRGYEPFAIDKLLSGKTENLSIVDTPLLEDQIYALRKDIPVIKYIGEDNDEHKYFPDIYIPHKNLIIEVKSSYTYNMASRKTHLKCLETSKTYIIEVWVISEKGDIINVIRYNKGENKGFWNNNVECTGDVIIFK